MSGESFSVVLRDTPFAGLSWGQSEARPVLALHGWLDNAASFELLAPLLSDCRVVAPDLAGHGRSGHRPPSGSYNIWDDLPDLLLLADSLGWQRFHLLGHSRGAIVALLLAAAMPERVLSLCLLDATLPEPMKEQNVAQQLHDFMVGMTVPQKARPVYADIDAAVRVRVRKTGIPQAAARLLVERGMVRCDGGLRWGGDPRLMTASAMKFSDGHLAALIEALSVPALVLLAQDGLGKLAEQCEYGRSIAASPGRMELLPGGHHMHMEAERVAAVAARVEWFISQATKD